MKCIYTQPLPHSEDAIDFPVSDVCDVVAREKKLEAAGTSLLELMTHAGNSVAHVAHELLTLNGETAEKPMVILAGSGNNGGDGWVAAEALCRYGHEVILVTKLPPESIDAEPARSAALDAAGHREFELHVSPDEADIERVLSDAGIIVDAILGTGFAHDEVRAPYAHWIRAANAAADEMGVPILSIDAPSGLNAQTGSSALDCIRATATLTMLAVKPGLLAPAAKLYVGELMLAPLVEG